VKLKVCSKCKEEKSICEFSFRKKTNKPISSCKDCEKARVNEYKSRNVVLVREKKKIYYKNNKEKQKDLHKKWSEKNKNYVLGKVKKWNEENKERRKQYEEEYRKTNSEKIKKYQEEYRRKHSCRLNEYQKNKRNTDPIFKLAGNMRNRIREFLSLKKITKKNKVFNLVGLTPSVLKEYIENQFTDGMSWNNYGLYGWHIDHIIPLSSAKSEEDLIKLCHYTNLQPLWAEDNLKKSTKLDYL
jgi:hypothetical protein